MRVTVIGSGYVGLVAGACLAETGNDVVCADSDERKIEMLRGNRIPIYEPGLEGLVIRNQAEGRLHFTTDVAQAVAHGTIIFIAVGTPPEEDGSADLTHVLEVAEQVGRSLTGPAVIVTKSTVPVGTAELVRQRVGAHTMFPFAVASNPEFLKEGAAIDDFMKPDRVVLGVDSDFAKEVLGELYAPFVRTGNPILFMDIPSAELTKYAANAMLASRISFMNQIAELCEKIGADVNSVRRGIGSDRRIGQAFLFPGPGYGGSCFPKDVKALIKTAVDSGLDPAILLATEKVNHHQKTRLLEKLNGGLPGGLGGRVIAVWGLAFKAETDDMRESPAIPLINGLLAAGASVQAFDPQAGEVARGIFGSKVILTSDPYQAAVGADALVVVTEWLMFRNPNFERLRGLMRNPLVVDGRNLYDPAKMARLGFFYKSIGRADVVPESL